MSQLTLAIAQKIVADALAYSHEHKFNKMGVVVVDARGALVAAAMEDGSALGRWKIALGKAIGAVSFGVSSRKIGNLAAERPHFVAALSHLFEGMVPVAGGVLIRDSHMALIGAAGMSGDTSDNDEAALVAAITAAGFVADTGA